jgi:hypothetical protein
MRPRSYRPRELGHVDAVTPTRRETMRKVLLIASSILWAAVLTVVAAPASASTTSSLEATFEHHYGAGVAAPPCASGSFCMTGTVAGYGGAANRTTIASITPIVGTACVDFTLSGTITLADANNTLTYDGSGTVCPIGNSHETPGSAVSYGNPYSLPGLFTIVGGTGVFAGASGSGNVIAHLAGDVEVAVFVGTITIP